MCVADRRPARLMERVVGPVDPVARGDPLLTAPAGVAVEDRLRYHAEPSTTASTLRMIRKGRIRFMVVLEFVFTQWPRQLLRASERYPGHHSSPADLHTRVLGEALTQERSVRDCRYRRCYLESRLDLRCR